MGEEKCRCVGTTAPKWYVAPFPSTDYSSFGVQDEPHELSRIKRALQEHLDMDASVTLSVLCDQILQPDEPIDEEEQQLRDRSRSLVMAFLTGDIKSHIVERHAKPGTHAEQVLVSQLLLVRVDISPLRVVDYRIGELSLGYPEIVGYRHTEHCQQSPCTPSFLHPYVATR